MVGDACKYDSTFICYRWGDCPYGSFSVCLKTGLLSYARQLAELKARQMAKHSAASIKWRNQAFYYKAKVKSLERWIMLKGFTVPKTNELQGGTDGRICGSDKEKVGGEGLPTKGIQPPGSSGIVRREDIQGMAPGQGSSGEGKQQG